MSSWCALSKDICVCGDGRAPHDTINFQRAACCSPHRACAGSFQFVHVVRVAWDTDRQEASTAAVPPPLGSVELFGGRGQSFPLRHVR